MMNNIANIAVIIFIVVLSIVNVFTFGLSGILSILIGHSYLLWNKSSKNVFFKYAKYVIYAALIFAYGYYLFVLYLIVFWKN